MNCLNLLEKLDGISKANLEYPTEVNFRDFVGCISLASEERSVFHRQLSNS